MKCQQTKFYALVINNLLTLIFLASCMIMRLWWYYLDWEDLCAQLAKPEDVGLLPEEESNDEDPSKDEYGSGDDAPAAGSGDESMNVDPVN